MWVVRVLQHRRLPLALAILQPLATSIAAVSAAATSAATSPHRLEHLMTSQLVGRYHSAPSRLCERLVLLQLLLVACSRLRA